VACFRSPPGRASFRGGPRKEGNAPGFGRRLAGGVTRPGARGGRGGVARPLRASRIAPTPSKCRQLSFCRRVIVISPRESSPARSTKSPFFRLPERVTAFVHAELTLTPRESPPSRSTQAPCAPGARRPAGVRARTSTYVMTRNSAKRDMPGNFFRPPPILGAAPPGCPGPSPHPPQRCAACPLADPHPVKETRHPRRRCGRPVGP
jgi:hypothetical protein